MEGERRINWDRVDCDRTSEFEYNVSLITDTDQVLLFGWSSSQTQSRSSQQPLQAQSPFFLLDTYCFLFEFFYAEINIARNSTVPQNENKTSRSKTSETIDKDTNQKKKLLSTKTLISNESFYTSDAERYATISKLVDWNGNAKSTGPSSRQSERWTIIIDIRHERDVQHINSFYLYDRDSLSQCRWRLTRAIWWTSDR